MVENKRPLFDMNDDEVDNMRQPLVESTAPREQDLMIVESTSLEAVTERSVENTDDEARKVGAGVAGASVGLLVGGPFLSILLGFGSAYATSKDGAAGDAARALGDVALVARAKAQEVDKNHHIVERSKFAANNAWENAKELDRKHNVIAKITEFVVYTWDNIKKINREHRVLERAVEGVGRSLAFVGRKVAEKLNDMESTSNTTSEETSSTNTVEAKSKSAPSNLSSK